MTSLECNYFCTHVRNVRDGCYANAPLKHGEKSTLYCQSSKLLMIITVFVYIKKVSHLPSQLCIFVFTFTVYRFHIYGALLHLELKVLHLTGLITFSHLGVRQTPLSRMECPTIINWACPFPLKGCFLVFSFLIENLVSKQWRP